jgi:hypothetical protein
MKHSIESLDETLDRLEVKTTVMWENILLTKGILDLLLKDYLPRYQRVLLLPSVLLCTKNNQSTGLLGPHLMNTLELNTLTILGWRLDWR